MMPLYITVVGSKLYGTNTKDSDTDFKGFGFVELDEIVGLKHAEQQEYTNNVQDGQDKIEGVVYDVKRLFQLLYKGNPTVLEPCCAENSHMVFDTILGKYIRVFVKENFITKHLFKPYSAYHRAQVRKLQSMERTGKRAEMVKEIGYDAKFASHAYRLAKQCVEIMKFGTLHPTLQDETLQMCKLVRSGELTKDQTLKILEDVDKEMYNAYQLSTIKEHPDFNKINEFLTDLYANYINWRHTGKDNSKLQLFSDLNASDHKCEILNKVVIKITQPTE